MPAAFHFALTYSDEDAVAAGTTLQKQKVDILQMSHGVSASSHLFGAARI